MKKNSFKKNVWGVTKLEVHNGLERLLPIFDFRSQQRILCCDNGFWCRDMSSLGPERRARLARSARDRAHDSHLARVRQTAHSCFVETEF